MAYGEILPSATQAWRTGAGRLRTVTVVKVNGPKVSAAEHPEHEVVLQVQRQQGRGRAAGRAQHPPAGAGRAGPHRQADQRHQPDQVERCCGSQPMTAQTAKQPSQARNDCVRRRGGTGPRPDTAARRSGTRTGTGARSTASPASHGERRRQREANTRQTASTAPAPGTTHIDVQPGSGRTTAGNRAWYERAFDRPPAATACSASAGGHDLFTPGGNPLRVVQRVQQRGRGRSTGSARNDPVEGDVEPPMPCSRSCTSAPLRRAAQEPRRERQERYRFRIEAFLWSQACGNCLDILQLPARIAGTPPARQVELHSGACPRPPPPLP